MRLVALVLTILFANILLGQDEDYLFPKFQNISLKDGLSNLHVTAICQDDLGYMYIGTARGLNRFDGLSFKHYFIDSKNSTLKHNAIQQLHKTTDNKIICATIRGNNIYDPVTDRLKLLKSIQNFNSFVNYRGETYCTSAYGGIYRYDSLNMEIIPVPELKINDAFNALINGGVTGIWGKAVNNNFLINYDVDTGIIIKYPIPCSDDANDGGALINIDNYILVAVNKKICFFDVEKREFIKKPDEFSILSVLNDKDITFVNEVEKNVLWFGTKGDGLYVVDLLGGNIEHYTKNRSNRKIVSDHFSCVYCDESQNIWLGSFDHGLEIAFDKRKNFNYDLELNSFTKNKFISSIESNNNGLYFFGTRFNGVYMYDSDSKQHSVLFPLSDLSDEKNIRTLKLDSENKLWISTDESLYVYDINKKRGEYLNIPKPNNGVVSFCESNGKMLAGTDRQGLIVYNLNGQILRKVKSMGANITQIHEDGEDEFVITSYGVGKGLYRYFYNNDSIISYNKRINLSDDMLSEIITCYFDSDSILWIGNFNFGLFRYDFSSDSIAVFRKKDGLPSDDITGIAEDNNGWLWISTAYGLSQFDKKDKFINYFYNEGLGNVQFHQKAVYESNSGEIFFGGNLGVTYFNPSNFGSSKDESPKIIFESLRVSNIEVSPGDEHGILDKSLSYTHRIRLNHKNSVFSVEYHAFDYAAANNIEYAYILEGFHRNWNFVEGENFASFSNLSPGEYTFKVKAKTNNGIWSEPEKLQIEVIAPPWLSIWAFIAYFILVWFIIIVAFRIILNSRLQKKNLYFAHKERQREKELSNMKLQFFTNISHEIRTPLTLIKGNVDYLESELRQKGVHLNSMESLKKSTNRLLMLVNQILSFRKLESGITNLSVAEKDIIKVSQDVLDSFKCAAISQKVNLDFNTGYEKLIVPFDQDKYEKILFNLISNSLKFSTKNGIIRLSINVLEDYQCDRYFKVKNNGAKFVEVSVWDNGKGISNDILPNIFNRFVNTPSEKADFAGSGIGLHYTKHLIDLHNGHIIADSEENVETLFSFVLPIDENAYYKSLEIEKNSDQQEESDLVKMQDDYIGDDEKKRTILLAEDDLQLNKFIVDVLSHRYNLLVAYNGEEALAITKSKFPDIIISDIMMPKMDGMELCRKVRGDELISHIPIILLTAKDLPESKIAGYEFGADDYITKPFELNILRARIANLLASRVKLQKLYQKGMPVQFNTEKANQYELVFMKKVETVIKENIKKTDFNVQDLADKMFMSRTSFYRKFMNVTDISPKEYINKYRINLSLELIKKGVDSIGEISFMCGFSSQSVFSVAFKKEIGKTPMQYKKTFHKISDTKPKQ